MAHARIVIVGVGFAGYQAARTLLTRYRKAAEVVLLNPTNYFLSLPLLPKVAAQLQLLISELGLVPGPAVPLDTDSPELVHLSDRGGA